MEEGRDKVWNIVGGCRDGNALPGVGAVEKTSACVGSIVVIVL